MSWIRADEQLVNLDRCSDVRVDSENGEHAVVAHDPLTHRSYLLGRFPSREEACAALGRLGERLGALDPSPVS